MTESRELNHSRDCSTKALSPLLLLLLSMPNSRTQPSPVKSRLLGLEQGRERLQTRSRSARCRTSSATALGRVVSKSISLAHVGVTTILTMP